VNKQEQHKKHQEQTAEIYAAIGQFAVKFEHVCHSMQMGIMAILQKHGLKDQTIGQAVLAGMTAGPLRESFISVIQKTYHPWSDKEQKMIKNINQRIQKLIETRNDMLHRMWFVGWGSESQEDFSSAHGSKFKNTGKGVEQRGLDYSASDFDLLSLQADDLNKLVGRLCGAVLSGLKIENNFILEPDGTVKIP
jgi:beta-mannanase